jgi:uncharacterized protein YggE
MQRGFVLLVVVLVFAIAAPCVSGEGEPEAPRLITVTGHAEVRVVPDEVRLAVGVETVHADLGGAKAENDARVAAVLAAVEEHGVENRHAETDFLSIEPRFKDRHTRTELLGYTVSKRILIDLHDTSRFESLLSAVLEAGVNHVYGIDFRTSDLRTHRDRARSLALTAAAEKAAAMAGQLGQRVGRPHTIREGSVRSAYGSPGLMNVSQVGAPVPDEVEGVTPGGQMSITAEVTVSFEMEDEE